MPQAVQRRGRKVGRIWRFNYTDKTSHQRERHTVTTPSSRGTLVPMRRFRPRQDYSRKLTRRITLADRTRLETLKDAADLFTGERFAGVSRRMTTVAIGGVFGVFLPHLRRSRRTHPVAAMIFGMRMRL
jgi:hypothetical protein